MSSRVTPSLHLANSPTQWIEWWAYGPRLRAWSQLRTVSKADEPNAVLAPQLRNTNRSQQLRTIWIRIERIGTRIAL